MKPIAIFRHIAHEGPGYLGGFLDSRNIPWQLVCIDAGDPVPLSAAAYSGLVFMGGPMSVNDDLPWIAQELDLIRDAVAHDIPVLGHCLGGQLMSKALGGAVTRNMLSMHSITPAEFSCASPLPTPLPQAGEGANESLCEIYVNEIGWGQVRVSDNETACDWFGDIASFDAFHWHGETFSLPHGATHLLSSEHCVNQAWALGKHLALQCHIEMTEEMIKIWCELGASELAAARSSPAVQSAQVMQRQAAEQLPQLHEVASRLYTKWLAGCTSNRKP
jgi:GMP synthase-like glutamine amidotransferase